MEYLQDRVLPANPAIGAVFYIEMENHNLVQPSSFGGPPAQLLNNPAAPYLNSLMTPGNPNAAQTAYASNYGNVLSGSPAVGLHPSEPNYIWQEAGVAGPLNDKDPYPDNIVNAPSLSALLQSAGIAWKSYQEDTDLAATSGGVNLPGANALTSTVAPQSQWTVPLSSFSGTSPAYTNAYNGSHQYDYAPKHDGQLYFTATNGGNDPSASNPQAPHYAPLQQLQTDLSNNTVARYNLITPNLFNDMHSSLGTNFTYNGVTYTPGDQEAVAQGDNFLSKIVPMIEASQAYKNNGVIVIRFDETEGGDTAQFTIPEVVISPLAKGNAFASTLPYTHSSDLKSMQELFGVSAPGGGFLGDANTAGTNDLWDMFHLPPTVTGLSQATGPLTGGTSVTITGTNLAGATAVKFGTAAGTIVSATTTQVVATAPAGSAGVVDVTVTTPGGTSATSAADKFTYTALPTVTGVSPISGPLAGGTSVTITGVNLTGATAVKFGAAAGTIVSATATQVVATSPAGAAGAVDVTVTTPGGTTATSAADKFTYAVPPSLVGYTQTAVGADAGGPSTVTVYNADQSVAYTVNPFSGFTGGVRTAVADFNGDGVPDLVVGTGPGIATQVLILDGTDRHTIVSIGPFETAFTGGVYVAAGDLNGDGTPDLVITPDEGGGPRCRVFDGKTFGVFADFFGIADPNFRGGARPAIADVNGDGVGDLIVSAGFGGGPRVAGFDGKSIPSGNPQRVFADFFMFEQTLRNGVFITAGDVNGDGFADVVAGGGPGGGPRVFALDGKALITGNQQVPLANFFGGDTTSRGGIRVAVKNLDGDTKADLVVGAGAGAGSRVTAYLGKTIPTTGVPPAAADTDVFVGFTGGVFVG